MTDRLSLKGRLWKRPEAGADVRALLSLRDLKERVPGPGDLPEAATIAARVERAKAGNERVGVIGDYDCDGVTSSALLLRFLKRRGIDPIVVLPHRVLDGYGMRPAQVQKLAAQGVTLLFTVDTGIVAHDAAEEAKKRGIDLIIIDHHALPPELPEAFAIVHPGISLPGHTAPSAAGLAYLLVEKIEGGNWDGKDEDAALAMLGTIADVVTLTGLNRMLARRGLEALDRLPLDRPLGLLAARIKTPGAKIKSGDVAFRIAPRINAAGRMDDPAVALDALLNGGAPLAELERLNALRQDETHGAVDRAIMRLAPDGRPDASLLAIADASFHPGIIGLIAGKLTEKFALPSIVCSVRDGVCTASLRGPAWYDLAAGLRRIEKHLVSHGGHAQAAGCSFAHADIDVVFDAFADDIRSRMPEVAAPTVTIDAVLKPEDLTVDLCKTMSSIEPFGHGNPEPLFLLQNVRLENPRCVGRDGSHVQCAIAGRKAVGFGCAAFIDDLKRPVDCVCRIGLNTWNGAVTPQIFIEDICVVEDVPVAV